MKKHIKKIISYLLIALCLVSLTGCTKTGPIPNGLYGWRGDNNIYESIYKLTENDVRNSYAIEVKGDEIQRWTSGSVDYKAKIVKKDKKIYLQGYKWKEIFSSVTIGNETVYEVIYDETEKSMTLILIRNEES